MGERDRYQSGYDRDRTRRDYGERDDQRRPRQWGSAENDQRDDRDRYAGYYAERQYGTRGPDEREAGSRYGSEEWRESRSREPYEGARRYSDSDYRQLDRGYGDYERHQGSSYTPGPQQSRPFRGQSYSNTSNARHVEPYYGQGWREQPSQGRDWRSARYHQDDEGSERRGEHESFGEQVREAGQRIARSVKRVFRGPKGYKRSDERIREDVSDRLGEHEYLDCSDVEVTVANGEVTLTGSVRSRHEKFLAEEITDDVSGVNEVHNQLRVKREHASQTTTESSSSLNATSGIEGARTRNARV